MKLTIYYNNNPQCRNSNEGSGREGEKGRGVERSGQEGNECSRRPLVNGFVGNVSNIIHYFISLVMPILWLIYYNHVHACACT